MKTLILILLTAKCFSQTIQARWNPQYYSNEANGTPQQWNTWGNGSNGCSLSYWEFLPTNDLIYKQWILNVSNVCEQIIPWTAIGATYTLNGTSLQIEAPSNEVSGLYEIYLLTDTQLILREPYNSGLYNQDILFIKETNLSLYQEDEPQYFVYPNPLVGNILHIKSNRMFNKTISIFDLSGKKIIEQELEGEILDVGLLSSGLYLMKIKSLEYESNLKFIVR